MPTSRSRIRGPGGSSPAPLRPRPDRRSCRLVSDAGPASTGRSARARGIGAAAIVHRDGVAALEARREEAESFAAILSGLSRSVSPDADPRRDRRGAGRGDQRRPHRRRPAATRIPRPRGDARQPGPACPTRRRLLPIRDLEDPGRWDGRRRPSGGPSGRVRSPRRLRPGRRAGAGGPLAGHAQVAGRGELGLARSGREVAATPTVADASPTAAVYGLPDTIAAPLVADRALGAIVLSRRVAARGRHRPPAARRGAARRPPRCRGPTRIAPRRPGLDRCPDRAAEPALLRRVLRPPGPRRRAGDAVGVLMIDIDKFKASTTATATPSATRSCARSVARSWRRSARTTSRPATAARSSSSCSATRAGGRGRGRRARPGAVGALDLAEHGVAGRQRLGRRRRGDASGPADRGRSSPRRTGPSTAPSAPVATGSSPPDRDAIRPRPDATSWSASTRTRTPTRSTTTDEGEAPDGRADQRRPRPDLPRHRRHARGQGRARVQDRRLPPGSRRHRPQPDRPRRRLPGGRDAAASPASARPSATRSASSRRPAGWPTTTGCGAEVPPTLVEILHIPGLGPKTVRQLHEQLGIESIDDLRAPPRRAASATCAGCRRGPSSSSSRASPGSRRTPSGCSSTAPRRPSWASPRPSRRSRRRSIEPAGSFRRRKETIGDLDLLVETDAPGAHRRVHRSRRRRPGPQPWARTRLRSACCAGRRST